jgi:hypothetical protein
MRSACVSSIKTARSGISLRVKPNSGIESVTSPMAQSYWINGCSIKKKTQIGYINSIILIFS